MRLRILAFLISFTMFCTISSAQNEIHFTQFQYAPIQLNPALTGDFQGTYRIGGIYRDQWFSFLNEGAGSSFKTLDMFIDVNIIRGLRKQDWISAGIGYDALDQGGSTGLKNTYSRLGVAYHLSFDKNQTNILTLGVQRASKSSNINKILPEWARGTVGTDVDAFNSAGMPNMDGLFEGSYSDWVFGATYNLRGKTSNFMIGIKANQLFNPRLRLAGVNEEVDPLIAVFSEYKMPLGDRMSLTPAIMYQTTGPASEFVVQSRVGYGLKENFTINGGLGLRTGDAVQILLGADYKQYKIGASYDVNISDLSNATGSVGGFELALSYIGNIKKKPKLKPVLICPRL